MQKKITNKKMIAVIEWLYLMNNPLRPLFMTAPFVTLLFLCINAGIAFAAMSLIPKWGWNFVAAACVSSVLLVVLLFRGGMENMVSYFSKDKWSGLPRAFTLGTRNTMDSPVVWKWLEPSEMKNNIAGFFKIIGAVLLIDLPVFLATSLLIGIVAGGTWVWENILQYHWQLTLSTVGVITLISYIILRERKLREMKHGLEVATAELEKTAGELATKTTENSDLTRGKKEWEGRWDQSQIELRNSRQSFNNLASQSAVTNSENLTLNQEAARLKAAIENLASRMTTWSFRLRTPHTSVNPRKEMVQAVCKDLEATARAHTKGDTVDALLYRLEQDTKKKDDKVTVA